MQNRGLIIWGVILAAVGALGLVVSFSLAGGSLTNATFSSDGQRIYYTGADADGPIPRSATGGMMGSGGMLGGSCVGCHGEDGRGGRTGMMFRAVEVPDIRYSTLTTARTDAGEAMPAWSDADIARAIRDGVEPNGEQLKAPMPRWSMTDAEVGAVIAYLKELSPR